MSFSEHPAIKLALLAEDPVSFWPEVVDDNPSMINAIVKLAREQLLYYGIDYDDIGAQTKQSVTGRRHASYPEIFGYKIKLNQEKELVEQFVWVFLSFLKASSDRIELLNAFTHQWFGRVLKRTTAAELDSVLRLMEYFNVKIPSKDTTEPEMILLGRSDIFLKTLEEDEKKIGNDWGRLYMVLGTYKNLLIADAYDDPNYPAIMNQLIKIYQNFDFKSSNNFHKDIIRNRIDSLDENLESQRADPANTWMKPFIRKQEAIIEWLRKKLE